jgi:dihydroflavonol-4-reductase
VKIALTGGSGFLGSHLIPLLLRAGDQVRMLLRSPEAMEGRQFPGVELCQGDVVDRDSCERLVAGCEVVIHLAGRVSRDPLDGPRMYRLHIEGTRQLLTAAAAAKIERVVLASTSGTIAVSRTERVATEADDYPFVTVGRWPYYLSKIYQERLALELSVELKLPVVVLNPSLLLGPGDARFSSVGDVWRFLHRDIPAVPNGGLSFVDVRDVAEVFHLALSRGRDGERYLLGAANMPVREFLERLSRLTDIPAPRLQLPSGLNLLGAEGLERLARWRGAEPSIDPATVEMGEHFFYFDSAKAKDELGFAPRDPQDTLRDTVRDLQARRRAGQQPGLRSSAWPPKTSSVTGPSSG